MIAVDSSVLLAQFERADVHHQAAGRLLVSAVDESLIAHPLTIAEVLVGAVKAQRADEMLTDLAGLGVVAAEAIPGEPLRLATLRVQTSLKLPDCCVLDTALTRAVPLATFDASLGNAARRLGLSVMP